MTSPVRAASRMRDEQVALARIEAKLDLLLARSGLDPRLSDLLPLIFGYWQTGAWTAAEILEVACQPGRRDLLATLDAIVGDRGDPAKRLGRKKVS